MPLPTSHLIIVPSGPASGHRTLKQAGLIHGEHATFTDRPLAFLERVHPDCRATCPPAHGSAEETARSALPETAAYDLPWARNNLENWWVSQISSKKLELEADGITYDNNEILRDHLMRRQTV